MPSCAVVGCQTGYYKSNAKYQLHLFPKGEDLRKAWIECLNRSDYVYKPTHRICSKHFLPSAFVPDEENVDKKGRKRKRQNLKQRAVPTLFMVPDRSLLKPASERPHTTAVKCPNDHSYAARSAPSPVLHENSVTEQDSQNLVDLTPASVQLLDAFQDPNNISVEQEVEVIAGNFFSSIPDYYF